MQTSLTRLFPKENTAAEVVPFGDNFSHPVGCTQELPGGMTMNLLVKILGMIGSSASIGIGILHFFVPKAWKWYSYIDSNATELVAAVDRARFFL